MTRSLIIADSEGDVWHFIFEKDLKPSEVYQIAKEVGEVGAPKGSMTLPLAIQGAVGPTHHSIDTGPHGD